jgi:quinone-modifying oxidoreductase subunit QmoC
MYKFNYSHLTFRKLCPTLAEDLQDIQERTSRRKKEKNDSFFFVILKILKHKNFQSCSTNRLQYFSHLLVFWGFILLLIVTVFAIIGVILFEYPFPITHPIKMAGNIGGVALISGSFLLIFNKLFIRKNKARNSYSDWLFVVSLFLLGFSGMLVEGARFHDWNFAYYLYFIHLLLVWMVIIYIPFTKFAHVIYRTIVLWYSRK